MEGEHSRPAGTSLSPLALAACIDKQHLQYGSPNPLLCLSTPISQHYGCKVNAPRGCNCKLKVSEQSPWFIVGTAAVLKHRLLRQQLVLRICHLYLEHKALEKAGCGSIYCR